MNFASDKAQQMPKSSKKFRLTNSGLNSQGFRMLTSGADLEDFKANPLMLFNHIRPDGNDKNQILPIGNWTEIELVGDEIFAVPVFDDNDPFAMAIYNKVESGMIKMCSIGAEALESTEDPKQILPNQTGETVTQWKLKECSICDIGSNPEAITVTLYDSSNKIIQLSADKNTVIPKLKKMAKTTKPVGKTTTKKPVNLADDAATDDKNKTDDTQLTDDDETQLDDTPADETPEETIERLQQEINDLKSQLQLATDQLQMADEAANDDKDKQLANKLVTLRKITLSQLPTVLKMLKSDRKGTIDYFNTVKSSVSVKNTLANSEDKTEADERFKKLSAKTFDELFRAGEITELKTLSFDTYAKKYKAKFGKEPAKPTV